MWGNLVTETAFVYNFTFGFPTNHSDILMHLTHWQYWFWFWFTYYMVLYYFIFLRLIRYRVLKMSPKLATSFRSHGKWGDLLVCFIPLSWCANILSNSNFILRMVEWQSESSLFTLRVRGKQWYWVYKFEVKSLSDISSTALNVGNNFWVNKGSSQKQHYLGLVQEKHNLSESFNNWFSSGQKAHSSNVESYATSLSSQQQGTLCMPTSLTSAPLAKPNLTVTANNAYYWEHSYAWRGSSEPFNGSSYVTAAVSPSSELSNISGYQPKVSRSVKIASHQYTPVRLIKSVNTGTLKLSSGNSSPFLQKPASSNFYLVVKQKRYSPKSMSSNKYVLSDVQSHTPTKFNSDNTLFLTQHGAIRSELPSLQSNRRLLRTRRVLVLPAHTNITLITNSFDVMHSWYVPGLGVKLDCVPGRSTHHTLHIDHAGFYYGQCAEICGRYHHHMPIRVCALPFEHFLIWWYHYGAPFFLAGNQDRKSYITNSAKQLNW